MKFPLVIVLTFLTSAISAFSQTEVRFSPAFSINVPNTIKVKGNYGEDLYVSTTPLITNKDIQSVYMFVDGKRNGINIILKPESAARVDESLKSLYEKKLAIFVNEKLVSAPTLMTTHFNGKVQITSNFSKDEATKIASDLTAK